MMLKIYVFHIISNTTTQLYTQSMPYVSFETFLVQMILLTHLHTYEFEKDTYEQK